MDTFPHLMQYVRYFLIFLGATAIGALTGMGCFLAKYRFLVGLSLDGIKAVHDLNRRDKTNLGTFSKVMRAL